MICQRQHPCVRNKNFAQQRHGLSELEWKNLSFLHRAMTLTLLNTFEMNNNADCSSCPTSVSNSQTLSWINGYKYHHPHSKMYKERKRKSGYTTFISRQIIVMRSNPLLIRAKSKSGKRWINRTLSPRMISHVCISL